MNKRFSEVQVTPVKSKDGLIGFASLVFDDCLYLGSIGIYTRPKGGYRLTYPPRKSSTSSLPIFHPINKEIAKEIEEAVISKYEEITAEAI